MDKIIQNPGFQHIVENILLNLDYKDLLECELINKSCQEILENPIFWLKKLALRGMSNKNQDDWYNAIQITKNLTVYGKKLNLTQYLKKIMKNSHLTDIPCYIDQNDLDEIERERLHGIHDVFLCRYGIQCIQYHGEPLFHKIGPGKIQTLSILMKNFSEFNALDLMHIFVSYSYQDQEVVKVMLPFIDDIDIAFVNRGILSPIFQAAGYGHINIIKLLAPLVNNPNSPVQCRNSQIGWKLVTGPITPCDVAEMNDHHEAARILKAYEKQ